MYYINKCNSWFKEITLVCDIVRYYIERDLDGNIFVTTEAVTIIIKNEWIFLFLCVTCP